MGDREVIVRLRADISQYQRQMATAAAETAAFGRATTGLKGPLGNVENQSSSTGREIDKLSGRLRLATDAALILGPALVPLGAAAVGGVVALSAQLGALAGGLGVTLLAVNGLGDGLKALDRYQLEPTAENLAKLNEEMKSLGPAGEDFVRFLDSIEPELKSLQTAARDGLFPGAQEGIESLMGRLPELRKLIGDMASTMGDLSADAGKALGGKRFDAFFEYLRTDGIQILDDTSRTLGALAEAAANTFAAFGGVSTDFSGGLLKFSQGLAEASANLDSNAGFQEFLAYIETEGPHALETLGSLANMLLQIVEATAPLGGPVLTIVGQFADAIARIADSDIGTPLFAGLAVLALLNRSMAITASLAKATFGGPAVASMRAYVVGLGTVTSAQQRAQMSATEMQAATATAGRGFGKFALPAAGLALTMSGVADNTGLANTAMLSMAGGWGAAAGFALDVWNATDGLEASLKNLNLASASGDIDQLAAALKQANAELEKTRANTILGSDALGGFVGGVVNTIAPMSNAAKFMGMLTGETDGLAYQAELAKIKLGLMAYSTDEAAAAAAGMVSPLQRATGAQQAEADAIMSAVDAMRAKRSEALRAANAELNYQAAIDDARKSLEENGKTVDETTESGRDNLRNLYAIAGGWNDLSDGAKNAKGSLRDSRKVFLDMADDMGMNADKAKRLADRLYEIPSKRKTEITVDSAEAQARIKALQDKLDNLRDGHVTVHVTTVGGTVKAAGGALTGGPGGADGGTVQGPRHPYGDKLTVRVAPGEEIISNRHGQADRFRRDRAAGRIPGYADGGTAGGGGGYQGDAFQSGQQLFAPGAWSAANALKAFAVELKKLQNALERSEKALDNEVQARDELASQRDAFMSTVGGAYSSADPFAAAQSSSGSVWAAGAGGANPLSSFDSALSGNTASTEAAQTALEFAASHGLDGPLYAALAASGNLPLLQAFAKLSSSEIDVREAQFAAQSNAQAALGSSAAAGAGMTQQLADANKHLDKIRNEVRELRHDVKVADANNQAAQDKAADKVKDGVNGAAANGHKHKKRP